jgi:hypothetical protein
VDSAVLHRVRHNRLLDRDLENAREAAMTTNPSDLKERLLATRPCREIAPVGSGFIYMDSQQRTLINPDGPEAAERISQLEQLVELKDEALREAVETLRAIIGNANEAPRFGPYDQIDNTGEAYQSAAFESALKAGRDLLARAALGGGECA